MTMNLQEVSDRFEIQDLIVEYCHCIDQSRFDDLVDVFSEDALIDYTAMGGIKGNRTDIIDFLKKFLFPKMIVVKSQLWFIQIYNGRTTKKSNQVTRYL